MESILNCSKIYSHGVSLGLIHGPLNFLMFILTFLMQHIYLSFVSLIFTNGCSLSHTFTSKEMCISAVIVNREQQNVTSWLKRILINTDWSLLLYLMPLTD